MTFLISADCAVDESVAEIMIAARDLINIVTFNLCYESNFQQLQQGLMTKKWQFSNRNKMVLRRFKDRRKQLIILLDKKAITEQGIL